MCVLLAAAVGCPGDTTEPIQPPPEAGIITSVAGDEQIAQVGTDVPVDPTVRVTSDDGRPVPGATVQWRVISGGGEISGAATITDEDGIASVGSWTLGPAVGEQTMRAAISGLFPAIFSATAEVGPPTLMEGIAGDGDLGTVELPARVLPQVRLTDPFGNPVEDVQIQFAISSGGGIVIKPDQMTDDEGIARVGGWFFGSAAGPNQMTATAVAFPELGEATFSVEAVLPVPASVVVAAGGAQGIAVDQDVMVQPTALVLDAADNPVPDIAVEFAVDAGGGAVTGPNATTGADGRASAGGWTVGPNPEENRMLATLPGFPGVAPATFRVFTALPGGFDIEYLHTDVLTASEANAFAAAKAFWESVIIDEFPDIDFSQNIVPANACSAASQVPIPHPRLDDGILDEVLIITQRKDIPVAGVIATAGPCANRNLDGFLTPFTALGVLTLDPLVAAEAQAQGLLTAVIIHEIGHALGFATNWWAVSNPVNPSRPASPGADTHFDGETARAAFMAAGGDQYTRGQPVPVDNTGLAGSADGHWRETVLGDELMTSTVEAGTNPFSAISVGAMHDLFYTVDPSAAEAFQLPATAAPSGIGAGRGFDMRGDHWSEPLFFIGDSGLAFAAPDLGFPGNIGRRLTREDVFRWKR